MLPNDIWILRRPLTDRFAEFIENPAMLFDAYRANSLRTNVGTRSLPFHSRRRRMIGRDDRA
jgi:hypothetical protein